MISKKDIEKEGLSPDYISGEAKKIFLELENKNTFDLNYVKEKANNILNFIKVLNKTFFYIQTLFNRVNKLNCEV